ncbi:MAG TPA: Gfo/Idh/MocA family oxidoreductase [Actinomycetota bacterium]|nr:Gfo/Idh/MocA family oxidoreductase [Actinomycetota bacterium]
MRAIGETAAPGARGLARPRLGFLGAGWIGRNRLRSVAATGLAEIAVVGDAVAEAAAEAAAETGCDATCTTLDEMLAHDLDGVVIATPSALHAAQCLQALEAGLPVFCQKPLTRTAAEAHGVVDAARARDLLLGVDLCYRHVRASQAVKALVDGGELGTVYALDLVFHNAYGPDKAWAQDPRLAGGGCVIDLATHLLDLALWLTGTEVVAAAARLYRDGRRLAPGADELEDHATAELELANGASVRLACSWYWDGGRDADIAARVYGSDGAAAVVNVDGSFYEFRGERYRGTQTEVLVDGADQWGPRAIVSWVRGLQEGGTFDDSASAYVALAEAVDRVYGRTR